MIKYLGFFVLFITACQGREYVSSISGNWDITFNISGEERRGYLILNNDQTGNMYFEANSESSILPSEETVDFKWKLSNDQLVFHRIDNDFDLIYKVQSISNDKIQLSFAPDIQVLLLR